MGKNLQDQLGNLVRVEVQLERKVGRGMAGLRDLCGNRQCDGKHDHVRGVVLVHLVPDDDSLGSLCSDAQRGQAESMHTLLVRPGKAIRMHTRVYTGDAEVETAVVRGVGGEQPTQCGRIGFAWG